MDKKTIKQSDDDITQFFQDQHAVKQAIQKGINDALIKHKKLGHPVCEWRDGKVVWIAPENIKVNKQ